MEKPYKQEQKADLNKKIEMQKEKNNLSNQDNWQSMKMENGNVLSYFSLPSNRIHTKEHSTNFMILMLFIYAIIKPVCLCSIAALITVVILPDASPFKIEMYIVHIVLLVCVNIFKEIYFDKIKEESDQSINKRTVRICKKSEDYNDYNDHEEITWGELQQGDVVFLQQGEVAPADIVLLDSQQIQHREAVTYIDVRTINGSIKRELKKSCCRTQIFNRNSNQKRNWKKYRKVLTGKIWFEKSSEDIHKFTGFLKRTKDPKPQKIEIKNLILRQSVIKTSLWVYGMVIYAGMESKIMKNFKKGRKNRRWAIDTNDLLFIVHFVLNIAFGTTFTLLYRLTEQRTLTDAFIIVYHFLMFSVALPILLYPAVDIFLIMFRFRNDNEKLQIRNSSNIQELGEIDYAMMTSVGILTTGRLQIDQIVTDSSVYKISGEQAKILGERKVSRKMMKRVGSTLKPSDISKPQRKNLLPPLNVDRQNRLVFQEKRDDDEDDNFELDDSNIRMKTSSGRNDDNSIKPLKTLDPLILDKIRFNNDVIKGEKQSTDIVKCLVLCHQAKFNSKTENDRNEGISSINSGDQSEEVLLKLANYVGWRVKAARKNKDEVGLIVTKEAEKINQLTRQLTQDTQTITYEKVGIGINAFQIERKLFSVVMKCDEKITLYCKGRPEDIMERLKMSKETQKLIDSKISSYANKSEVLIYAKRQFTEEEKENYINDSYSLTSLTTTKTEIQEFSKKYQSNLEFVCLIGMSIQTAPMAEDLTKNLMASGIKIAGFLHDRADIASIKKLIFEDEQLKQICLEKESTHLIRYYLNEVTNSFEKNQKIQYLVIVNGAAWRQMSQNSEVVQHFLFVLYYSQGMLAYGFEAEEIAQMARKIRFGYPREHKILGIGYSYTDLKFLGECNIGIGISKDLPTDIKASQIDKIQQIIRLGPYLLGSIISLTNLVIYKAISITIIILLYEIVLICYSVSNTLEANIVFFYLTIFNALDIIYDLIYNREPKKLANHREYSTLKSVFLKFKHNIIEAVIHGATIFLSVFFSLTGARLSDGRLFPVEAFHLATFIVLISVGSFKKVFTSSMRGKWITFPIIINYVIMSLCVFAASMIYPEFNRVGQQFIYLFSCYDSIITMINTTIFCLAISFFIEQLQKKKLRERQEQKEKTHKDNNQEYGIVDLVKYLFQDEEQMDKSLSQLVAGELDANEMKICRCLLIKNDEDHLQYKFQNYAHYQASFTKAFALITILNILIIFINVFHIQGKFQNDMIPIIVGFLFSLIVTIYAWKFNLEMCYYPFAEVCIVIVNISFGIFMILHRELHTYLLICVLVVFSTDILEIRLPILVIQVVIMFIVNFVLLLLGDQNILEKIFQPILGVCLVVVSFLVLSRASIESKINFIITESFTKENNYVNDILSILVPKFIKDHLEENVDDHQFQHEEKNVCILFCYVCNFDEIIKEEGTNVVPLMDDLFRQFDELCPNYAVQKIETVGMTYMAATGIKMYEEQLETAMKNKNPVERLLKMAIQMLDKAKDTMWGTKKNKQIRLKVGIHSGNVVVGVIGHHKPQFSLIGDTVNTTSRHCSTAFPGEIVLSAVAREKTKKFGDSAFIKAKKKMKGLGETTIYRYTNKPIQINSLKSCEKFQKIVKKLIEILKKQGTIKQKPFKAEEITQILRRTRLGSDARKSSGFDLYNSVEKDEILQESREKHSQFELRYNFLLQLNENENPYKANFRNHLITKYLKADRFLTLMLGIVYALLFVIEMTFGSWNYLTLSLKLLGLILFPIMIALYRKSIKNRGVNILITIFQTYLIVVMIVKDILMVSTNNDSTWHQIYLYPILILLVCSCQVSFRFVHMVFLSVITIILIAVYQVLSGKFEIQIIYETFFCVFIVIRKYNVVQESYKNYSQTLLYEKKTQDLSALVSQLLPKHAYQKLKNQSIDNRLELTDKFEFATMLFADIVGFTAFSNQTTPFGVVKMLRGLFLEFDKSCLKHNVYKLYTIGDCYVVLGFTNCYQRNYLQQAKNVVNMGLNMVEVIQKIREELKFYDLDMRIGIHTGTIIGGIIGTEIVRYDIYGPNVMIANKFQENGKPGHVHISESTKEILEQDKKLSYNIIPNKEKVLIEKLNAEYNGYFLEKKKFQV